LYRAPRHKPENTSESESSISVEPGSDDVEESSTTQLSFESSDGHWSVEADEAEELSESSSIQEVSTPSKPKRRGLWDGTPTNLYVWYQDQKKWYLGTIIGENKYKNKYRIKWADEKEDEELVALKEENHTTDSKNSDRWCWENEIPDNAVTTPKRKKGEKATPKATPKTKTTPKTATKTTPKTTPKTPKATPKNTPKGRGRPKKGKGKKPATPKAGKETETKAAPVGEEVAPATPEKEKAPETPEKEQPETPETPKETEAETPSASPVKTPAKKRKGAGKGKKGPPKKARK